MKLRSPPPPFAQVLLGGLSLTDACAYTWTDANPLLLAGNAATRAVRCRAMSHDVARGEEGAGSGIGG